MYEWNEQRECLVDYMGLPVSLTETKALLAQVKTHLKKTPEQLAEIATQVMAGRFPKTAKNNPPTVEEFQ